MFAPPVAVDTPPPSAGGGFDAPAIESRALSWRIEHNGTSYRFDDATVAHLAIVALLSGHDSWESLSAHSLDPTTGYMMAVFWLAAFLVVDRADERGIDADTDDEDAAALLAEVLAELKQMTAAELAASVHDI